jgi:hypothetical protein
MEINKSGDDISNGNISINPSIFRKKLIISRMRLIIRGRLLFNLKSSLFVLSKKYERHTVFMFVTNL